ncbi:MAG: hypothetical protein AAF467_09980 [Actinomycetota bacterium]
MKLERGTPPSKWIVRIVIALVALSQGAALFGDFFLVSSADQLADSGQGELTWGEAALLILLNPRNRNLAFATIYLDAFTYYSIGFFRLVISDPLYFLLGYWYGERAIAWTERRSRTYGPVIRQIEGGFRGASYPLIFLAPNNIICALSAATGVRISTFIALNLSGTVVRLVLVRLVGETFSSPIATLIGLIARFQTPLLIITGLAIAWTLFGEFRGRNESELTALGDEDDGGDGGSSRGGGEGVGDEADSATGGRGDAHGDGEPHGVAVDDADLQAVEREAKPDGVTDAD